MLFTSMEFLFLFLPCVLAVNFILPRRAQNYWLLMSSLLFYAWGEPKFVFVMIGSIVFNYFMALLIAKLQSSSLKYSQGLRKLTLAFTVICNLAVLFVFKYMNFTTQTLNSLMPHAGIPLTHISLHIGISFFTFQAMSYVIDVYRGVKVQKNLAKVGLYVSLFPQLIAGPIVRYTTVEKEMDERTVSCNDLSEGVMRFMRGFNKKMLLANTFAVVADAAWTATNLSVAMAWLGCVAYTLQIFFDFSGYSDMAIGLGRMLGFHFLENFNYPYISKTISEFWRRWHISMGTWFRDYVYFPLGGSRVKSNRRLVFNLFVVWMATGLWHGANWTFIAWGLLYGVLITLEKFFSVEKRMKKWNRWGTSTYQLATLLAVCFGWVLFRSATIGEAAAYFKCMFGLNGAQMVDSNSLFYFQENIVVFVAGILCSVPLFGKIHEKLSHQAQVLWDGAAGVSQFLLFIVSISYLVISAHNPFIYFNF